MSKSTRERVCMHRLRSITTAVSIPTEFYTSTPFGEAVIYVFEAK